MRFRGKSVRRKIVGLLLVPLVSLTSIWAFATVLTGREAKQLYDVSRSIDRIGDPTRKVVGELQQERRQTLVYLSDPRRSDALKRLNIHQITTDRYLDRLRENVASGAAASGAGGRLNAVLEEMDGLDSLRSKVEEGTVTRSAAFTGYNDMVDACFSLLASLHGLEDAEMDKQGRALIGLARAREALSQEDALLSGAFIAGRMDFSELRAFSDRIAQRRILYTTNLAILPPEEGVRFDTYWHGSKSVDLRVAEDDVVSAGANGAVDAVNAQRWHAATDTVLDDLDQLSDEASARYRDRVEPVALAVLTKAGFAGIIGLIGVITSIAISVQVGRGLVRDLTRLRKTAHEVSGVRLPSVMRRLAAGERVDVETEAPRLAYGHDEMGQVGQALNTLQRAAVEAAVKQADMRRGVSEVFVNLARRSQVLLHRQLTLLDTMEKRTEDAGELADLFRLDHMTTRMRRHAEGLVILSGAAPSRQWRKPVRLMDVVRAAVAEVEDYERVEVRRLPRMAVKGPAVADLTHLLAELIENATVFSPPHTTVQVIGERVPNGFTLEIHDRGLGMAPDVLLDANLRLAETPEFELSDTDRLGLFVVSRLALRQGVRVSLQPSPYGGTTAVVFLPAGLLTEVPAGSGDAPGRTDGMEDTGELRIDSGARAHRRTPTAATPRSVPVLDTSVELEAPVGASDEEGDEEGLIFRKPAPDADAADQHQQAGEPTSGTGQARPGERQELPRRKSSRPDRGGQQRAGSAEYAAGRKAASGGGSTAGGLPRRKRHASLTAQVKARPVPGSRSSGEPAEATEPDRDAEDVRARMASLQRGWQRGRAETGESPAAAGETAPGTTSEGDGR
ncbi:sensor histidine kinase [Streptomyces meridianus]|uniref:histidine kinase n=1 Tax=Streptomyces meridianus TaxID=2938945 RepID=A0ABT0X9P2_9ACTN|nr:nitrate- and nitrite sensing domain-containing protein [Streptomyces meridianus]MCM2579251.1 nitrate- and nitrite sensing domain-containing protein [Streptomyces meridianus]